MRENKAFAVEGEGLVLEEGEDLDKEIHYISGPDDHLQEQENFAELFEKSLQSIQEGKVVTGEVVGINKEYVLVNVGFKSDGRIPIREFLDLEGHLTVRIGDKVDVFIERIEDDNGRILISKEKAEKTNIWDRIEEIYEKEGTVKGKIIGPAKGGMTVDIGIQAFLPGSHIDLAPVKNMDSLLGAVHDFRILKYNKRQDNIVLSRRAILEAERCALREKTLKLLEEGAVLEGTVKNIADYGLFIDLGGIDGLVHISEISWSRTKVRHPSDIYHIGDRVKVKVLHFDRKDQRVSLSIKQLKPDPWVGAEKRYPIGKRIECRVVNIKGYGAFVEVEEGIEGLIHVSELSWNKRITHPSQILNVGDIVDAVILNIEEAKKRLSLSMKQAIPNPWDKYTVGDIIKGKVRNIKDFGMFVSIDEGIDGFVHISNITRNRKLEDPSELYKEGHEVEAIVLRVDKEKGHFSLGIKQLIPDPWDRVHEKYQPGMKVSGTVTNITNFGIFLELEEGVEGLVHMSQISRDNQRNSLSCYQLCDVIQAVVLNVSPREKRISLSISKLDEDHQRYVGRS